MRYAVPTSGGMIAQHFGHCEQFALFDVDEGKKEIVKKEMLTPPAHQPGVLPAWLAEQGASVVIAGGMGSRAQMLFAENRIQVAVNVVATDPEKAVMAYIDGLLEVGDDVCDH